MLAYQISEWPTFFRNEIASLTLYGSILNPTCQHSQLSQHYGSLHVSNDDRFSHTARHRFLVIRTPLTLLPCSIPPLFLGSLDVAHFCHSGTAQHNIARQEPAVAALVLIPTTKDPHVIVVPIPSGRRQSPQPPNGNISSLYTDSASSVCIIFFLPLG